MTPERTTRADVVEELVTITHQIVKGLVKVWKVRGKMKLKVMNWCCVSCPNSAHCRAKVAERVSDRGGCLTVYSIGRQDHGVERGSSAGDDRTQKKSPSTTLIARSPLAEKGTFYMVGESFTNPVEGSACPW